MLISTKPEEGMYQTQSEFECMSECFLFINNFEELKNEMLQNSE
jgi:hypothetical protein